MRWFNRYNFPYSNFHDLNLDWIIKEMNRLIEEWEQVKAEWEQMKIDWAEFQAEMQRLWQEYKDLMNAAWEAYKANLNDEWETYQNNLNEAWDAFQAAMNDWKDSVDQDIQDKFDEIDAKCAECLARVQAALDNLNNVLAEVQQQVTDYLDNLPYETIIHDTTIEWLDEHGVTVSGAFLTPEEFGAVGDGVTNDRTAFTNLFREAAEQKKPIALSPTAIYNLGGATLNIPKDTVILGNGATIKVNYAIGLTIGDTDIIIKDLNVDATIHTGQTQDISNLYLENVKCKDLDLAVNLPISNNIVLKDIVVSGTSFSLGTTNNLATDFNIDNLTFTDSAVNANISGNGFIRAAKTSENITPATLKLWSTSNGILIESHNNLNLSKYAGSTADVKVAQYSNL